MMARCILIGLSLLLSLQVSAEYIAGNSVEETEVVVPMRLSECVAPTVHQLKERQPSVSAAFRAQEPTSGEPVAAQDTFFLSQRYLKYRSLLI